MLQYFIRIENCQYLPKSTTGHGFNGWLGIGFQNVLRSVVAATGDALQDKYETGMVVEASRLFENSFENCTFFAGNDDPYLSQWLDGGHGPYTQGAAPAGMLVKSSISLDNDTDLFFFGAAAALFDGVHLGDSRAQFPLTTFFWSIVKMHPQNRAGTVKLLSSNPRDAPDIKFNFFKHAAAHDLQALQALREGVEFARRIFNETQGEYGPFTNIQPPNGVDIEQNIMQEAYSHYVACSCPMRPAGCVDSRFRVYGVDNLQVVDASIFLRVSGAFPILPVVMTSEKACDVIMEDGKGSLSCIEA